LKQDLEILDFKTSPLEADPQQHAQPTRCYQGWCLLLSKSNVSVADSLRVFKSAGLDVGFLVPTDTGLAKSIMDAHASLRAFFLRNRIHNYDQQDQGPKSKVLIDTLIITSDTTAQESKASLYRPRTKTGDPRIWIYDLGKHASPSDLLALFIVARTLIVLNVSRLKPEAVISNHPLFKRVAERCDTQGRPEAQELIELLRTIGQRGWLPTMRPGDTGVGYTLEAHLGISANSSKAPDYKGIELKSHRDRGSKGSQITLFSQVPDWKRSTLQGSLAVMEKRGRYNEAKRRRQLFHEISCSSPNSYGLQLSLTPDEQYLHQVYVDPISRSVEKDVQWEMSKLQTRMREKHRETVWVSAATRGSRDTESFHFYEAKHTWGYDEAALPLLLETGEITVHYLIKQLPNGSAKDQGYLFKTKPKNTELLFAHTRSYPLC
jgi:hypothetical protein